MRQRGFTGTYIPFYGNEIIFHAELFKRTGNVSFCHSDEGGICQATALKLNIRIIVWQMLRYRSA